MKKLVTTCLLLGACLGMQAQSQTAIDRMAEQLNRFNAFEMRFVYTGLKALPATLPDTLQWHDVVRGHLTVKGNRFKLQLPRMQVWSDGQKAYQYIPEYKEINVTPNDAPTEVSLTSRPDLLISQYSRYFSAESLPKLSGNGLQAYRLTPVKKSDSTCSSMLLWIHDNSFLPALICVEEPSGAVTAVALSVVRDNKDVKDEDFAFNPASFPKDTEVIDLTF